MLMSGIDMMMWSFLKAQKEENSLEARKLQKKKM